MISHSEILNLAHQRESIHVNHASSRPLSKDYEYIGLIGEWEFGLLIGQDPDISLKPKGDGGIDFTIKLKKCSATVDVKTARKAYNLIHEQGKPFADIYVLAMYDDLNQRAEVLGWEQGSVLKKAPVKDFGYGIVNHYIPANKLYPIRQLIKNISN